MNSKNMKSILFHIKYPYTALIITIMWIGMAMIISSQKGENLEILIFATAICTLIVAKLGFKVPK
jgi:hypothetical protein